MVITNSLTAAFSGSENINGFNLLGERVLILLLDVHRRDVAGNVGMHVGVLQRHRDDLRALFGDELPLAGLLRVNFAGLLIGGSFFDHPELFAGVVAADEGMRRLGGPGRHGRAVGTASDQRLAKAQRQRAGRGCER
jgi:hypothetical protein